MAERTNQNTVRDTDSRHRQESHSRSASARDPRDEDVIASLANARENRRARQVGEWERVGIRTMYRVA
jgi:hypothetical protein